MRNEPSLNQPVVTFMRPIVSLTDDSSLERAAANFRNGASIVPVIRAAELMGVVTERALADALAAGVGPYDAVEAAVTKDFGSIGAQETGAAALRLFATGEYETLLVRSQDGRVLGSIAASDLYPKPVHTPRPPMVGGMATPFGVYLTNGALGAGVKWWALVASGAILSGLSVLGVLLQGPAELLLARLGVHGDLDAYVSIFPLLFLLCGMRLIPLSGIHAAEHKVVHAIERGEPLVPEVVDRMSRVHPRCGTNYCVGAMIFLGILSAPFGNIDWRAPLAVVATLFLWQPLGSAAQWLFTTRPPNRKQLEMGIKSGKELLERYRLERPPVPSFGRRLWTSGIVFVALGGVASYGLAALIAALFHVDIAF